MKYLLPLFLLIVSPLTQAGPQLDACVQELCGAPSDHEGIEEYVDRAIYLKTSAHDRFQPRFSSFIESRKAQMATSSKQLVTLLGDLDERFVESLSEPDKKFILFLQKFIPAVGLLMEKEKITVSDLHGVFISSGDFTALLKENGSSEEEARWLNKLLNEFRTNYKVGNTLDLIFAENPHTQIRTYTSKHQQPALKVIHEAIQDLLSKAQENKSSLFWRLAEDSLRDVLAGKELEADRMSKVNLIFAISEFLDLTHKDAGLKQIFSETPEGMLTAILEKQRGIFEDTQELLNLSPEDIDQRFENAAKVCRQSTDVVLNQLPTAAEIESFRKYLLRVKSVAGAFLDQKLPPRLAAAAKRKLESIEYDLPLNQENYAEEITVQIQREIDPRPRDVLLFALLFGNHDEEIVSEYYPFGQLVQICQEHINQDVFSDQSAGVDLVTVPFIQVSWTTLKDFARYKGVFAHELGHQLFALLRGSPQAYEGHDSKSKAEVEKMLACLNGHGPLSKTFMLWNEQGNASHLALSLYANEDFSDQFSALVERSESGNMACVFVDDDQKKYLNLSLKNPLETDPHSSGAYRVLSIEKMKKGNFPPSCQAAVDEEKLELKNCLE